MDEITYHSNTHEPVLKAHLCHDPSSIEAMMKLYVSCAFANRSLFYGVTVAGFDARESTYMRKPKRIKEGITKPIVLCKSSALDGETMPLATRGDILIVYPSNQVV